MDKAFVNIPWKNRPNKTTALNEGNLNRVNNAVDVIDNRVITLDSDKLDIATANTMLAKLEINSANGIIKATLLNGTVLTWDLNLEKIPARLYMTSDAVLVMETDDGQSYTADLKKLIDTYLFDNSAQLAFAMSQQSDGKHVTATIKAGSITEAMLQTSLITDIRLQAANAAASATAADEHADRAEDAAAQAKAYRDDTEQLADEAVDEITGAGGKIDVAIDALQDILDKGGFVGAQGPQGTQGIQGIQGPIGVTGAQGIQGPRGFQGEQGSIGPAGNVGPVGPQGIQGNKGDTGAQGVIGATGNVGPVGPQGIQGNKGDKGDKGDRGDSGVTVPISGIFTLSGDVNGNLYAYYADGSTPPQFEVDGNNNIYYITPS